MWNGARCSRRMHKFWYVIECNMLTSANNQKGPPSFQHLARTYPLCVGHRLAFHHMRGMYVGRVNGVVVHTPGNLCMCFSRFLQKR